MCGEGESSRGDEEVDVGEAGDHFCLVWWIGGGGGGRMNEWM